VFKTQWKYNGERIITQLPFAIDDYNMDETYYNFHKCFTKGPRTNLIPIAIFRACSLYDWGEDYPVITFPGVVSLPKKEIVVDVAKENLWKYLLKECPGYDQIYSLSRESSGFHLLKRKKPGDCVICQRNHDKSDAYIFIKGPMQNVLLGCYRSSEYKLLACMKPECQVDYEEPEEVITEGALNKDQKYILPLSMEDKVQVIIAPMGMGKTHALVEFLKKQDRKVRILCLSPRISDSDATYGRFGDARLEFEHYLGADINKLYKCERLILQMESLYKISEDYNIK